MKTVPKAGHNGTNLSSRHMGELGERDSSLTISLEYIVRLCLQEKKKKQREEAKREGGRKRERGWKGSE